MLYSLHIIVCINYMNDRGHVILHKQILFIFSLPPKMMCVTLREDPT